VLDVRPCRLTGSDGCAPYPPGSGAAPPSAAPPAARPAPRITVIDTPHPQPGADACTVADLVAALPGARLRGDGAVRVADATHDSRDAGPGVLFAARPGQRSDGHDHAPQAVAAGTPALLVERELDLDVPQVVVDSVARALGPAAARVHSDPSAELLLLGVTGTNGKTTTATLLEAVLAAAGHTAGLVGTIETRIAGEAIPGVRTTPEATDLQRLWRRMRAAGATAAAMEVSSHGLALHRIDGTRVDVAAFTNLTQDHLDFHADMEDYYRAKARLFAPGIAERGVVVVDDGWGRRLAAEAGIPVTTASLTSRDADWTAQDIEADATGTRFTAVRDGRRIGVTTQLPGAYNVANCLLALAVAEAAGIDADVAAAGIAALPGVAGRMERVDAGQPFGVLVDYAHTPDSVASVLRAARGLTDGRVIVVIGCGGDRDAAKRPLMGRAAADGADLAVLTSDNPRSEDPEAILDAVAAGAGEVAGARVARVADRRAAIGTALAEAGPGDVVVIAGKGHETTQEHADRTVPFDDRAVARELLLSGGAGAPVSERRYGAGGAEAPVSERSERRYGAGGAR
jgi:UDP-N-acetylmuramoyl-L-alanyl-D-glutamate--2,6-diaminopimelate ligase